MHISISYEPKLIPWGIFPGVWLCNGTSIGNCSVVFKVSFSCHCAKAGGEKNANNASIPHRDIHHFSSSVIVDDPSYTSWLSFKGPDGSLSHTCRILGLLEYWFIHFGIPSHWFIRPIHLLEASFCLWEVAEIAFLHHAFYRSLTFIYWLLYWPSVSINANGCYSLDSVFVYFWRRQVQHRNENKISLSNSYRNREHYKQSSLHVP